MSPGATLGVDGPRRGLWRRRKSNRRVDITGRGAVARAVFSLAPLMHQTARLLRLCAVAMVLAALLGGMAWGSVALVAYVKASPRFALQVIAMSPTTRVPRDELLALGDVREGAPLLALDPVAIARRLATHPWLASVRVRRRLPSTLEIELVERTAAAVASLDGLYLVDATGRPFKRATMDDADGLPVITGLSRPQFVASPAVAEAAFREALAVAAAYRARPERPPLSEVAIDPRHGFSLFLLDGGAEIRLGRGQNSEKLAQLDRILESLGTNQGEAARRLRRVDLDAAHGGRVAVLLAN